MTITINGSGSITGLSAGGLPDATVTQADLASGVAGTGPAFSAYQSSVQTVTNSTWTKLRFQSKAFDTASCFDNVTNYRFTPNVAGYYQVSTAVRFGDGVSRLILGFWKNGNFDKAVCDLSSPLYAAGGSALVDLNGTTDYVEAYCFIVGANSNTSASAADTWFQGVLVRAA